MAQIRVVEKRSGLAWLWSVVALVVAAVLVWYFMGHRISASTGDVAPGAAPAATKKDTALLPQQLQASPAAWSLLAIRDAHHLPTPSNTTWPGDSAND